MALKKHCKSHKLPFWILWTKNFCMTMQYVLQSTQLMECGMNARLRRSWRLMRQKLLRVQICGVALLGLELNLSSLIISKLCRLTTFESLPIKSNWMFGRSYKRRGWGQHKLKMGRKLVSLSFLSICELQRLTLINQRNKSVRRWRRWSICIRPRSKSRITNCGRMSGWVFRRRRHTLQFLNLQTI